MVFIVFTKDNIDKKIKSNEGAKRFHGTSICAFLIVKSADDGIARCYSQNYLMGTVSNFSLPQSYTKVPPLLKKYKEHSCALPTINIPEDVWCEVMESFLSVETTFYS